MIYINNDFKFGDVVKLVYDQDVLHGMVVLISVNAQGSAHYTITWEDKTNSIHEAIELELVAVQDDDFCCEKG